MVEHGGPGGTRLLQWNFGEDLDPTRWSPPPSKLTSRGRTRCTSAASPLLLYDWLDQGTRPSAVWNPPKKKKRIWQWKNNHAFRCRVFPSRNGNAPMLMHLKMCVLLKNKVMFQPSMLVYWWAAGQNNHLFVQLCFHSDCCKCKVPGTSIFEQPWHFCSDSWIIQISGQSMVLVTVQWAAKCVYYCSIGGATQYVYIMVKQATQVITDPDHDKHIKMGEWTNQLTWNLKWWCYQSRNSSRDPCSPSMLVNLSPLAPLLPSYPR